MHSPLLALASRHALTLAVALAVFGIAFDSGGYPLTTRNALAIGVWWAIAATVALMLLPLQRPTRAALACAGLLAGLAALSAASIAWADSAERAFAEFNRVSLYVGVLLLAVLAGTRGNVQRWRDGMAIGIAAIGLIALASRLFPDLLDERGLFQFLPGGENRLSYPLDYWNGLGIFAGLGFPLLLGAAVSARSAVWRAIAVAPLPALAATIFLTSSRGGAATALAGTLVFLALTARRGLALGAIACAAGGTAAVVGILLGRDELVDGPLQSAAAADQGEGAALLIALFCLLTGAVFALAGRFVPRPALNLSLNARRGLAIAGVLAALVAVAAIDPVDRFNTFKKSPDEFANIQTDFTSAHLLSESGSGRWQFWEAAGDQFEEHPLLGDGAGSFEAFWAQNGSLYRFIRDAHSLYLETLGELGLIGLALLVGALGLALFCAASRLRRAKGDDRVMLASLAALLVAWCIAAGIDWMWELTAVTVVAMLALGLLTGPATARPATVVAANGAEPPDEKRAAATPSGGGRRYLAMRAGVVGLAVFVILTQALPLLAQTNIRDSQAAAARGDLTEALDAAEEAHDVQPWAASPQLQQALVEEQAGSLQAARSSILQAIGDDSSDWRLWLVRARLETKLGDVIHAGRSLRRAERLNPRSPLFADKPR